LLFIILFAAVFLASCAAQPQNQNWPGLAVHEDTIYAAYGPGFFAFDAAEQQLLWQYSPENAQLFFYAPPSVAENSLVIGDYGASGGMLSPKNVVTIYGMEVVDQRALNERWARAELANDRIVAGALQVDDVAYVATADNTLFALDSMTGEELWRFNTEFSIWARPLYYEGQLFVTSLDRHLYALDAASGALNWKIELGGAISARPVIHPAEELIYVASFDRTLHALNLVDGVEQWSAEALDWIWSAPALDTESNVLYYADAAGNVFAADAVTGVEVWKTAVHEMNVVEGVIQDPPLEVKGAIQASPVLFNGTVFIASEGNPESEEGLLVALDSETGAELWQKTTPAPLFSTPVIAGDAVVIGLTTDTAVLTAFDPADGTQLWAYAPPRE
jgi:outer membrane protein assembly factor BamB